MTDRSIGNILSTFSMASPFARAPSCRAAARTTLVRSFVPGLLAGALGFLNATQAASQQVCRPALAFTDVQFSKMQRPTLERKWSAVVLVDASRCVANAAGYFEIVFSRSKEIGMEAEFREEFMWMGDDRTPALKVEVDFWADEAVERYWFGPITPCVCRG
jgi:hypothetical protein